jgi:hypothetical protein
MNRAQRIALLIALTINLFLVLHPPFQAAGRLDIGHYWLFSGNLPRYAQVHVNLIGLAAEIAIVFMIGFTAFTLVRDVSDERFGAIRNFTSACRRRFAMQWSTRGSALRLIVLGPVYVIGAVVIVIGLAIVFLGALGWAIVFGRPG